MTNEEKQKQKPLASEDKEKTGRPPKGTQQRISDELAAFAKKTKDRISKNFGEFLRVKKWSNREIIENLSPFVATSSHASKLLSGDNGVPLPVLVILHKEFGVDLNEFIAGDKTERATITQEQVEVLREIVKMYDDLSSKG